MNNILPFVPAAATASDSGFGLYSNHMLAELLALQGGMIAPLSLERPRVADPADFTTGMFDLFLIGVIDQHEKTAALFRARIGNGPTQTGNDDLISITPEDSFYSERLPAA